MSDKKRYLVKAAESRKHHGYIWRCSAQWLYGRWILIELSDETAQILQNDRDIDIEEYKGQEVEYTTDINLAVEVSPKSITEIVMDSDYDDLLEEKPVTPKSKPKTSTKKKGSK